MPGGSYGSPSITMNGVRAAFYVGEGEDQGAIRESAGVDRGVVVSIDFILRWSDRIKFLQGLFGSSSYSGGEYFRQLPTTLPQILGDLSPGLPGQIDDYQWYRYVCTETGEFQPKKWRTDHDGSVTGTPGWGFYEMVVIPTVWGVPTYIIDDKEFTPDFPGADLSGFPFTTTRIRTSGEAYSPYSSGYKFAKSGDQIDDSKVGLIRPKSEITITRHGMPFIDTEKYEGLIGSLNDAPFKFGNNLYDVESIIYLNYEYEPRPDVATGGLTYDLTHHLVANGPVEDVDGNANSSWNWFVEPGGRWDQVVTTSGGNPVYPSKSLHLEIWPEYAS